MRPCACATLQSVTGNARGRLTLSAGQGRRVNNITTESNTTKMIHERCTKCTVNTGVTLQQYERVIVRNNLRAPVNTDPTKPIHTASVTGRITGRRGRSQ